MNARFRLIVALGLLLCVPLPGTALATTAQYYMNPTFPTNKNVAAMAIGQNYIGSYKVPDFGGGYGRQCVEYVDRFYYYGMGYNTTSGGLTIARDWTGHGYQYYGSYVAKRLSRYANKGATAPRAGDILCFSGGPGGYGHVAIVTSVGSNYVKIIEQNYQAKASIRSLPMSVSSGTYTVASSASGMPCQGWLRAKYSAPTLGTVSIAGDTSLKMSWSAVRGANGYEVYRSTSSGGTYKSVRSTTGTSFTDAGLAGNATYYYKVRAYHLVGSTKIYGAYSGVKSAFMLAAPKNPRTEFALLGIGFRWDPVAGATGYEVWRSMTSGGTYTRVKILPGQTTTGYNDQNVSLGQTYYYKARAYKTIGTTNVYGSYSAVTSGRFSLF